MKASPSGQYPPMSARIAGPFLALSIAACGGGDSNPDAPVNPDPDAPTAPDAAVDAGPPVEVTATVVAESDSGVRVIAQDGDGPWQLVTAGAGDEYTFTVTTGRYGFATLCADDNWQEMYALFATTADAPPVWYVGCGGASGPTDVHPVTGTISGLTGYGFDGQLGVLTVSDNTKATTVAYEGQAFEGSNDFMFGRYADGAGEVVDRLAIARDIAVAGPTEFDVDFATDGVATELHPVEIALSPGQQGFLYSAFRTRNEWAGSVVMSQGTAAPFALSVPPASQWGEDDSYHISLQRADGAEYQAVVSTHTAHATIPASYAPEFLEPLSGPVVAIVPGVGHRLRAVTPAHDGTQYYVLGLYSLGYEGCGFYCFPYWQVEMTPAYAGPLVAITTPDPVELEALGVWDARIDVVAGSEFYYDFVAVHPDVIGFKYAGISDLLAF
jgi:hypothetical protein